MSSVIAFIGLGNMGLPMSGNLVTAGHVVRGFDVVADNVTAAEGRGVKACETAKQAADGADVIITMLPAGAHVSAVYDELLGSIAPNTLMIDCSTIDVATARDVANRAQAAGAMPVDAPVSGGVGGAEAATLPFMVGGDVDAFARAEPILQAMGKKIVHCGGAGNGQAAKICNNMLLGISMIGVCEAFTLAEKLGLSHQALFDVSSTASGQCWSLTTYCPVPGPVPTSPANNAYKPGFAAELMLKDLGLSQDAARASGAETPLGAAAEALYRQFVEDDGRGTDFSGIIAMLRASG